MLYVINNLCISQVKADSRIQLFRAAPEIVQANMEDLVEGDDFNLPDPSLLKRQVNRVRQKMRPVEPVSLDFQVNEQLYRICALISTCAYRQNIAFLETIFILIIFDYRHMCLYTNYRACAYI